MPPFWSFVPRLWFSAPPVPKPRSHSNRRSSSSRDVFYQWAAGHGDNESTHATTIDHSELSAERQLMSDLPNEIGQAAFPALYGDFGNTGASPPWVPAYDPQQFYAEPPGASQGTRSLSTRYPDDDDDEDVAGNEQDAISAPPRSPREALLMAVLGDIRRDLDDVIRSPLPRPDALFSARRRAAVRGLDRVPRVGPLRFADRPARPARSQTGPARTFPPSSPSLPSPGEQRQQRKAGVQGERCHACGRVFRTPSRENTRQQDEMVRLPLRLPPQQGPRTGAQPATKEAVLRPRRSERIRKKVPWRTKQR